MRLYMFEHCSLCFRVRMTAALKKLDLLRKRMQVCKAHFGDRRRLSLRVQLYPPLCVGREIAEKFKKRGGHEFIAYLKCVAPCAAEPVGSV